MTLVWKRSKHAGTHLLVLLALADHSDDDGNSYPAVSTLAAKCRMKPRNANYILAALQASGELEVRQNEGPKGTNRYRIALERLQGLQPAAGGGLQAVAGVQGAARVQPIAPTPAMDCAKPLQPIADETSLNRQEPSGRPTARHNATRLPICPVSDIVAAYHEALPELPRVKVLGKARVGKIKMFWMWLLSERRNDGTRRAETSGQAMKLIADFFARARDNDFIMGRSGRGPGHENWRASIDYLVSERGVQQVLERTEATA